MAFERRHPGLTVICSVTEEPLAKTHRRAHYVLTAHRGDVTIAVSEDTQYEAAIYRLSEKVYKLNSLEQMDAQGWRGQGTGELQPLQAHHVKPRSKGRNDGQENLSGVTQGTHSQFHEKRHLARRDDPE
jgi:5-methylcytosine-specific restriction endonuclease McrA